MSISANELKMARHNARLTQSELADLLGVSLRTVSNWEAHGSVVPARSTDQVAKVLKLDRDANGTWQSSIVHTDVATHFDGQFSKGIQSAESLIKEQGKDGIRRLLTLLNGAKATVEFAEVAADSGAKPEAILQLLEAVNEIAIDVGLAVLPIEFGQSFLNDVVIKGTDIAHHAVDTYSPDGSERPVALLGAPRDKLKQKMREYGLRGSATNVGGSSNDAESVEDTEIPENVEEVWGLAAHPKTDAPEDHTP